MEDLFVSAEELSTELSAVLGRAVGIGGGQAEAGEGAEGSEHKEIVNIIFNSYDVYEKVKRNKLMNLSYLIQISY